MEEKKNSVTRDPVCVIMIIACLLLCTASIIMIYYNATTEYPRKTVSIRRIFMGRSDQFVVLIDDEKEIKLIDFDGHEPRIYKDVLANAKQYITYNIYYNGAPNELLEVHLRSADDIEPGYYKGVKSDRGFIGEIK